MVKFQIVMHASFVDAAVSIFTAHLIDTSFLRGICGGGVTIDEGSQSKRREGSRCSKASDDIGMRRWMTRLHH